MLILNAKDLERALGMKECIEAMRTAFIEVQRDGYFMPLRSRVRAEQGSNWMTLMPSMRTSAPARWALKQMVVVPANSRVGLDPLQGAVLLHDGNDGRLLAIADVPTLTTIRTAATTALATLTLAPPDVRDIAIIGTGVQGRTHVRAMRAIFPHARIRVWGRSAESAATFAEQAGCKLACSIEEAVHDADVVCTVTASHEPILDHRWLKRGCHLNAIGSSTPAARELDGATLAAARLFVDRRNAALTESGDVLGALREGVITPDHIQAELGEVLEGLHPGRRSSDEFTLYKSLGFGAQDLAAIELALQAASKLGLGTEIDW